MFLVFGVTTVKISKIYFSSFLNERRENKGKKHTSNTVLMAKMKLLYTDAWIRCQCFCHCGVVKKLLNMFYNLEMIFVFFFIYFCKCQWQMHAHTHAHILFFDMVMFFLLLLMLFVSERLVLVIIWGHLKCTFNMRTHMPQRLLNDKIVDT